VRACIVGGGLAGSLLAWRLAGASGWDIDLVLGPRRTPDATAASGGAVRAYERLPEQRRLATLSMAELLSSGTLRRWAGYRQVGSVYLRRDARAVGGELAEIARALPGSARLVPSTRFAVLGWRGLPPGVTAVVETRAGYVSPDRLREAVLADAARRGVAIRPAAASEVIPGRCGLVGCAVAGQRREYDVVVVAAGAWTATVLRASGLPSDGYRTKSIQYAVFRTGRWRPPAFVDESTGLYGRPYGADGVLLGVPTDRWDVDPDRPPRSPAARATAVRLARARFPRLRIGPAVREVCSADCYCDQPLLALRPVVDSHQLFSFSGGSGGSVKTALAASHQAAIQLVDNRRFVSRLLSDAEKVTS
jgi:glycine/D-amino acid oxidase-like deaminating enzyme